MNDSDAPEQTAYYPQYITAPKGLPGTQEAAGCTEEPREISGSRIARCALSNRTYAVGRKPAQKSRKIRILLLDPLRNQGFLRLVSGFRAGHRVTPVSKRYLAPISRLLNLIRPEDIDRWKYPLAELQRDLDDTIDTFASLGRS